MVGRRAGRRHGQDGGRGDTCIPETPPGAVPAGVANHLVVTLDDAAETIRIYVNGVEVASSAGGWSGLSTAQDADPLVIGMDSGTGGGFFSGSVDEVAVYGTALRPGRVAAHYAAAQSAATATRPRPRLGGLRRRPLSSGLRRAPKSSAQRRPPRAAGADAWSGSAALALAVAVLVAGAS